MFYFYLLVVISRAALCISLVARHSHMMCFYMRALLQSQGSHHKRLWKRRIWNCKWFRGLHPAAGALTKHSFETVIFYCGFMWFHCPCILRGPHRHVVLKCVQSTVIKKDLH